MRCWPWGIFSSWLTSRDLQYSALQLLGESGACGLNEGHITPCAGSRTQQKLLRKLETNFIEIWIKIQFQGMNMKMMFAKCQPFFLCLNVRHPGKVMHKCIRKQGQDWFRLCLVACLMPSHYLKSCWITAKWTIGANFGKTWIKIQAFSFKKQIWNCHLQNVGRFIPASMY